MRPPIRLRKMLRTMLALISVALMTPSAHANMLITYTTDEMSFDREFSSEVNRAPSTAEPSDFLYWRRMKFEISFITPDFELYNGNAQQLRFDDPEIQVKAYSLAGDDFLNPLVLASGSYLTVYTYPDEEQPSYSFSLKFSEMGDPTDSIFSYGSLDSSGRLGSNPENYDEFTFKQFNWPYHRHDQTWYFDTTTYFVDANTNGMTIERLRVTEPLPSSLLLIGLVGLALSKRYRTH